MKPTSYRAMTDILRAHGAVPLRRKGSHELWRFPWGATITVLTTRNSWGMDRHVQNAARDLRHALRKADVVLASDRGGSDR